MEKPILTNRKSQVWGFDLMMAIVIFLVGLIAIYIYAINFLNESQEILDALFYEGNLISSLILSEGAPKNWNSENVDIPGILTEKKINQAKLDEFYSLSQNDYNKLKILLGTQNEFYFSFSDIEITSIENIEGIGKKPQNPENLIRIERFSIYKNKPIKFALFIWN